MTKTALLLLSCLIFQNKITGTIISSLRDNFPIEIKRVYQPIQNFTNSVNLSTELLKQISHNSHQLYKSNIGIKMSVGDLDPVKINIPKQTEYEVNFLTFLCFFVLNSISLLLLYLINKHKIERTLSEKILEKEKSLIKTKIKFIENIAHETRTPLTLINGALALAKQENPSMDKHTIEMIDLALKNCNKINEDISNLIQNVHLTNPLYNGKINFFCILTLLNDVLDNLKDFSTSKQLEFILETSIPLDLQIKSNKEIFAKIISNLIINTANYSSQNSTLIINVDIGMHQAITISIAPKDQTSIIQNKKIERIQFPYTKHKRESLVSNNSISKAKNWAISIGGHVKTDSKKSKTIFTINAPKKALEEKVNKTKTTSISNTARLTPKTTFSQSILIVDDNIGIIDIYLRLLQPSYNCNYACDVVTAINLAKSNQFDLIISDIMMPELDGFKFRELIKELDNYVTIPFIFISAKHDMNSKISAYREGVDDYITKPFQKDELLARVANLIKTSKSRKEWTREHPNTTSLNNDKIDPFL